jgi:hypothetical protein
MKKIFTLIITSITLLVACKKVDLAGNEATGEGLVPFTLKAPASGTTLQLNAAIPNTPISIEWAPSTPGLNTPPTYKWIAALKATGNLENPIISIPSNNNGKDPKLTLTYKQLDDALKSAGIAEGAKTDLIWGAEADNGSTKIKSQNSFNISLTRFKDGATPFLILGPVSSTTPVAIDPGATNQNLTFRWTRSNPAPGGPAINYKVLFSTDGNFNTPLFSLNPNAAPADTTATISYKEFSDSLNKYGQTNLSQPTALKWTVVASSGTWKQTSDYINDLAILREVRLYMPGSFQSASGYGNDWTPATAPELIRDLRPGLTNNVYYAYMFLAAGTEFKITQGRAWDVNYGGTGGVLTQNGDNFKVINAGVYRISVDRTRMSFDIRPGRIGLVGDATAAGWNPPNVFPATALSYARDNLFIGVQDLTAGGWKMIDNDQWNDGSNPAVFDTRSYGSANVAPATMEVNGVNFPNITTPGRYRIIWDGRNVNNIKYELSPATEMRVVGDGIQGVAAWTPGVSPQMTYAGNGKWTITTTLVGGKDIKFLAGNDWGAFDYEDSGDAGSAGSTVKRGLRWEGGDNFKTPASTGVYTIELDENAQTVSIHP